MSDTYQKSIFDSIDNRIVKLCQQREHICKCHEDHYGHNDDRDYDHITDDGIAEHFRHTAAVRDPEVKEHYDEDHEKHCPDQGSLNEIIFERLEKGSCDIPFFVLCHLERYVKKCRCRRTGSDNRKAAQYV